ncbi:MAG TPA: hypothetical protein VNR37_03830 [Microbacteriaceae bacterium]|nr:hypothetical protein [Microbacteriaceae bacterium]
MASNLTRWIRERLATAPAIYGLIVYVVLIAATSDYEHDAYLVFVWSALGLIVFYLAHSFAEGLAAHDEPDLWKAAKRGLRHSLGMLYSAVLPSIAILVCALVGLDGDHASDWALLVGLVVLGYLGYQATADRGKPVWVRILSAFVTALLGFVIMIIDYAVH